MQQVAPSSVPFVEYVLKVIEHPPHMFVSKLAACCTTLFLTRSDPHLLRSLCHKWAIRFSLDRRKLIRYIKERSRQAPGQPDYQSVSDRSSESSSCSSSSSSDDDDDDEADGLEPCGCNHAHRGSGHIANHDNDRRTSRDLKFCDPEKAEEHFLSILNSLVPIYFSWNWHRTDHVIKMNKEHELYIRENVLPICIAVPAEDGVDDDEAASWLCPPRSFLRGCSEIGDSGSATQSVSQFYGAVVTSQGGVLSPRAAVEEGSRSPVALIARGDDSGQSPLAATHGLAPASPPGLAHGSPSSVSDRTGAAFSSARLRHNSSTALTRSLRSGSVSDVPGQAALTLMTLSNYKAVLTNSPNGTVMIFHAEYSMKSNDLLQLMQDIVHKHLLDPMPTVAVVYTVTEPELSALYEIQWIPTIIFTPPITEGAFDAASKSVQSMESDSTGARLALNTPNSAVPALSNGTGFAQVSHASSPLAGSSHGLALSKGENGTHAVEHAELGSNSALRAATPSTDEAHRDPKNTVNSVRTFGMTSTVPRTNSVDGTINARTSVSATTSAATNAAAQLLYGIDLDKRRRKQCTPTSEQPFASPVSNSARSFDVARLVAPAEASLATPMSGLDSLEHTAHDSLACASTPVDELMSLVDSDDHRVYPVNGLTTTSALVEWINSKGTAQPRLKKAKEFVTRVAAIRAEQKFKQFRELHSAVVMLRRLQCGDGVHPSGAVYNEPPLFIFLGGGMAAGKSTAAMALAHSPWWKHHKDSSVLVNADEFKVADPLYETQHSDVHARSTRAAENLLVQAVNQGRSIVFDGTMMWKPFVEQVVAMVRNAHTTLYRQGPGYVPEHNIEEYFMVSKKRPSPLVAPYKIVLLGITVEPEVAVPRGFLRKFSTGRGVPISTQLKSFKYFAQNFDDYMKLVDRAVLYNNNVFVDLSKGELPPVLAEMTDDAPRRLHVFDEPAYQSFLKQRTLNTDADNYLELYPQTVQ